MASKPALYLVTDITYYFTTYIAPPLTTHATATMYSDVIVTS